MAYVYVYARLWAILSSVTLGPATPEIAGLAAAAETALRPCFGGDMPLVVSCPTSVARAHVCVVCQPVSD